MEGNMFVKVNNISKDVLPFKYLIPSGRYRADINLIEGNKENVIFMSKLYFATFWSSYWTIFWKIGYFQIKTWK